MKYSNPADEWVHGYTADGFSEEESGDVSAPTGWFASVDLHPDMGEPVPTHIQHYGTPYLIIAQSNEGFVTVLPFDDVALRDRRYRELDQAYALYSSDITPEQARDALNGYRESALFTAVDARGVSLDGRGFAWSEDTQRQQRDDVIDFITQNADEIREWQEGTRHEWLQVGIDFWLSRNGMSAGYSTRDGSGAAGAWLVDTAAAWGKRTVGIDGNGELSQIGTES